MTRARGGPASSRGPARGKKSDKRLEALLRYHQVLLADARRNRTFARALRRVVRPGSAVVDLGAGTGIWAVLAARLGARRVVAIEKEPLLAPVIERLARENGVADRVQVVSGDSRSVDLGRSFDVVVSETVGSEGFDEQIVPLLADARRRFLRRGGVLVPRALSLFVAPARSPLPLGLHPRLLSDRSLRELLVHAPNAVDAASVRLQARGARLLRVVLGEAEAAPARQGLAVSFSVRDGRKVDCFALWSELDLCPGVRLSTLRASAWGILYFPVEPSRRGPCRLHFELDLHPRPAWRVRTHAPGVGTTVAVYDPLLAWGSVRAARGRRR